jgi:hypothetical protein
MALEAIGARHCDDERRTAELFRLDEMLVVLIDRGQMFLVA